MVGVNLPICIAPFRLLETVAISMASMTTIRRLLASSGRPILRASQGAALPAIIIRKVPSKKLEMLLTGLTCQPKRPGCARFFPSKRQLARATALGDGPLSPIARPAMAKL